jgi:hypothetical protein
LSIRVGLNFVQNFWDAMSLVWKCYYVFVETTTQTDADKIHCRRMTIATGFNVQATFLRMPIEINALQDQFTAEFYNIAFCAPLILHM